VLAWADNSRLVSGSASEDSVIDISAFQVNGIVPDQIATDNEP